MINIKKILEETFKEFFVHWNNVPMEGIVKHNIGLKAFFDNPQKSFYDYQHLRYEIILKKILSLSKQHNIKTIADFGSFSGIMAVALSKLGFKVIVVEKFDLYYGALDPIKKFLLNNNCEIIDYDSVVDTVTLPYSVDLSLSMALVEHLIGSPKNYFNNIKNNTSKLVLLEIPNIASFYKRIKFLFKGEGVFDDYDNIFNSHYPYFGHNHEYNLKELEYLVNYLGQKIEVGGFSYINAITLKLKLYKLFTNTLPSSFQDSIYGVVKIK
jgi:hypothetical protein